MKIARLLFIFPPNLVKRFSNYVLILAFKEMYRNWSDQIAQKFETGSWSVLKKIARLLFIFFPNSINKLLTNSSPSF